MPNGSLSREVLHREFISALGNRVVSHSNIQQRPLEIDLSHPFPSEVRVYLYTVTKAGGSRPDDELNIQVFIPGVDRGEKGSLDYSDERLVVLAGYHQDSDVFVLWDAYMHPDLSYSETVQVKLGTIKDAERDETSTQTRHLREGDEIVVAARSDSLAKGILKRVHLTRDILPDGADPAKESEEDIEDQRAVDYETPTERETTTTRIIRDTGIVNRLKEEYDYRCQVCGDQRKRGKDAYYAEGHHLKPFAL